MADPIHLQPTAALAERVLLPGDPGRALRLAQQLLQAPRMFNHHRGLWGYSGVARHDGAPLTIQSTGIGGPSAAVVIAELAELGARTLVRVGTCGAIDDGPALGELLAVSAALCADGTSRALGAGERAAPTAELHARLREAGGATLQPVVAVSTDLFYDGPAGAEAAWARAGAAVVEMQAATLFTLAARRVSPPPRCSSSPISGSRCDGGSTQRGCWPPRSGSASSRYAGCPPGSFPTIRSWSATSSAAPAAAWSLFAEPARWHRWAPHVRGAVGLGNPEVRAGARGVVRLAGIVPVPARILAVSPGRSWDWRVGPVTMRHRVEPRPAGCEVRLELRAPGPLEAALAATYGPIIAALLRNLARVAASEHPAD